MTKLILSILCLLFGHDSPDDSFGNLAGDCDRCGQDARPAWLAELELMDRLEALAIRSIEAKRRKHG